MESEISSNITSQRKNINLLYLLEIFSGFARGSYLVCIGWTALVISNSVATVGKIFILASVTNMISGSIIGIIIDRYSRKYLIIISHFIIAATMLLVGILLFRFETPSIVWLFLVVIIVISSTLMFRVSFDGKIRELLSDNKIISVVARTKGIHLLSTAVGTLIVGIVIDSYKPAVGFFVSAVSSILLAIFACFLSENRLDVSIGLKRSFTDDFKIGLDIFKNNKTIRVVGLLSIAVLPIGQLSNALLSSFIRNDLGEGSDVFGVVDAAWPIGGVLAALVLSGKANKFLEGNAEFYLSACVGITTILFSFCIQIPSLTVVHGLIGFFWTLCQILFNGIILKACDVDNVGRTRVYIQVMVSLAVMIMCFSPSIVLTQTTSTYFTFWGVFVVLFSILLLLVYGSKSTNSND